jgi:hypothetical protein
MSVFSRVPIGTNILDREWDVLLILDTCRIDALYRVAPEYNFLSKDVISSIWSVGSSSSEWIAQTFTQDRCEIIEDTVYVSGNAWAERVIEGRQLPEDHGNCWPKRGDWNVAYPEDFQLLEQAWKYEPENRYGLAPGHPHPRYVTDRVIDIMRSDSPGRLIAHYSQPHAPYTANARAEDRDELHNHERAPWDYLKDGGKKETVYDAYLDDLRMVLDDVELLLESIDAETVIITADHGDAFGEYFVPIYGHGIGLLHPKIRRVPWVKISATDEGDYESSLEPSEVPTRSAEDQLEALGYM